jgi:hypothetical protein
MEVSQIKKKLMKDLRQSTKWSKYLESIGWKSISIQGNFVFLKKIGFFSLIKIQRPENISKEFLNEVDELSRKEKGLFIKLEPSDYNQIDILKEAKEPLTKQEIIDKVLAKRMVKSNTVSINLQDSKYFKKDKDGKYFLK